MLIRWILWSIEPELELRHTSPYIVHVAMPRISHNPKEELYSLSIAEDMGSPWICD
jgi:hypothetical protein